jgi:hypothetical protein
MANQLCLAKNYDTEPFKTAPRIGRFADVAV